MKYLLGLLEGLSEAPNTSDAGFQRLLTDVQAGKTNARSTEAFYESLERIVNELKSTTESGPFQKPVSRKEAPDYFDVIRRPMDLQTVMRHVKTHKYKTKAEFAADLDLIWENCFYYNTKEDHPVRLAARFMKQKTDHHLEFLADKNDKPAYRPPHLSAEGSSSSSRHLGVSSSSNNLPLQPSPLGGSSQLPGVDGEEDAAGESDDAMGEESVPHEASTGQGDKAVDGDQGQGEASTSVNGRHGTPSRGRARSGSVSRGRTDDRSPSVSARAGPSQPNGSHHDAPPLRPKLQTSLEASPALIRTPHSMKTYSSFSLTQPGTSFSDKGKAKEILNNTVAPSWWVGDTADEEVKLEGCWWGLAGKDEGYANGLPGIPFMPFGEGGRSGRIPRKRRRRRDDVEYQINGDNPKTPPRKRVGMLPDVVELEDVVHDSVNKLCEARSLMIRTMDFQRVEAEGGMLPLNHDDEEGVKKEGVEKKLRKRKIRVEKRRARKRRKVGGEIGEREAVEGMKRVAGGLLAHAGFEGANEIPLDLMTRVAIDHIRGMGKTLRLFMDGFSQKMAPDEIILHALHEHGQTQTQDLEDYIKDDIERENVKITEMTKRVKQAHRDIATAPAIEDDMLLADDGEMLIDGNFADELGEDFLGLRNLGIEQEHGMFSLTIPSSLFYGRRKRQNDTTHNEAKENQPEYPHPPPFVPLDASTISTHLPALLHAFYASRIDSGLNIKEDDLFDAGHNVIGSLGQIITKNPNAGVVKKKRDREEGVPMVKKQKVKKIPIPGVGKGNWIRPSKEERERRAIEKRKILAMRNGGTEPNGVLGGEEAALGEEVDAEGEEE